MNHNSLQASDPLVKRRGKLRTAFTDYPTDKKLQHAGLMGMF